jgi:hypothetical protein
MTICGLQTTLTVSTFGARSYLALALVARSCPGSASNLYHQPAGCVLNGC